MLLKIDNDETIEMLVARVTVWESDEKIISMFEKMYEKYVNGGFFDNQDFCVAKIVDNDYINYTRVIRKGDSDFKKIFENYKNKESGNCSFKCNTTIEACDDEKKPTMFLVRM